MTSERTYTVPERMGRTTDGRVVPYTDAEAAFLAYFPGQVIPWDTAVAEGLVPGGRKEAQRAEDKMAAPVEDKSIRRAPCTGNKKPARKGGK